MTAVLELERLTVAYRSGDGWLDAIRDVSLTVAAGQTYGLVGESGSGKSTLALALMRALPEEGRITSGRVRIAGRDVTEASPAELRELWRRTVKFVPQNPLPSLNPSHTVGRQLREVLDPHDGDGVHRRALELLGEVGLADPERVSDAYPHQLSGGMQQRVMIAMALGGEPTLLVMDEPTTNLDVTTEATILDLVRGLVAERDTAVLYVSHSLGVVAGLCDRVAVLYGGELVEDAPVADLYHHPLHPYSRGLLDSVPRIGENKRDVTLRPIPGRIPKPDDLPPGCIFAPRCPVALAHCHEVQPELEPATPERRVRCHRWKEIADGEIDPRQPVPAPPTGGAERDAERDAEAVLVLDGVGKRFPLRRSLVDLLRRRPSRAVHAVDDVDLSVDRGRTLGLVGESGSGKSTLARTVIGLLGASEGEIRLRGRPLEATLGGRDRATLAKLQMVFQSSDEALNPFLTVEQTLRRPLMRLAGLDRHEADRAVEALLEQVQLGPDYRRRRPDALSGGEKQRVAIARAFAARPDLIVFDESVSGLDVSVQAAILNLLAELQLERDTGYVFISHDLSVVAYLADEIAVVYLGRPMEVGPTREVLEPPYHPYTEALLSAIPVLEPDARRATIRLQGEVPSPVDVPSGCPFHTRCPRVLGDICRTQEPPWRSDESGRRIYCHIPLEDLTEKQERVFTFAPQPDGDVRGG